MHLNALTSRRPHRGYGDWLLEARPFVAPSLRRFATPNHRCRAGTCVLCAGQVGHFELTRQRIFPSTRKKDNRTPGVQRQVSRRTGEQENAGEQDAVRMFTVVGNAVGLRREGNLA